MTDWDEAALTDLRIAARARDGGGGVAMLALRPLAPVLQHAGDVLIAALGHEPQPGTEQVARKCLEELDGRGRPGDAELAAELSAALGAPRDRGVLTGVPVDLGTLGLVLEDEPATVQVVDLRRGDLLTVDDLADEPGFDARSEEYEPQRWLIFSPLGPYPRDLAEFASSVADAALRERLLHAYEQGRLADLIPETPVAQQWRYFLEERQRGRARHWLADQGYRPTPRDLL